MIRRPPRSTLSSSSAASDVYKRQVFQLGAMIMAPSPSQVGVGRQGIIASRAQAPWTTSQRPDPNPIRGADSAIAGVVKPSSVLEVPRPMDAGSERSERRGDGEGTKPLGGNSKHTLLSDDEGLLEKVAASKTDTKRVKPFASKPYGVKIAKARAQLAMAKASLSKLQKATKPKGTAKPTQLRAEAAVQFENVDQKNVLRLAAEKQAAVVKIPPPIGKYSTSCAACTMAAEGEFRTLTCTCCLIDGQNCAWNASLTYLPSKCKEVDNHAGALVCQEGLPTGSYSKSCNKCSGNRTYVSCDCCYVASGQCLPTEPLEVPPDCGVVDNRRGKLVCANTTLPEGPYQKSCQNCTYNGFTKLVQCACCNRPYTPSTRKEEICKPTRPLLVTEQCNGVYNSRGVLQCRGALPPGGYLEHCSDCAVSKLQPQNKLSLVDGIPEQYRDTNDVFKLTCGCCAYGSKRPGCRPAVQLQFQAQWCKQVNLNYGFLRCSETDDQTFRWPGSYYDSCVKCNTTDYFDPKTPKLKKYTLRCSCLDASNTYQPPSAVVLQPGCDIVENVRGNLTCHAASSRFHNVYQFQQSKTANRINPEFEKVVNLMNQGEDAGEGSVEGQEAWETFLLQARQLPPKLFSGQHSNSKGIVILGGGSTYFVSAWVDIIMIRTLNCTLPIELWIDDTPEESLPRSVVRELESTLGVEVRVLDMLPPQNPNAGFTHSKKFVLKPAAVVFSRFQHVIFLDADNIPLTGLEVLFDLEEYQSTGAVFWPDFPALKSSAQIWKELPVSPLIGPQAESGQMVIDKARHWSPLMLALYFNIHADWYYPKISFGDKDTYQSAWFALQHSFTMAQWPVSSVGYGSGCSQQRDCLLYTSPSPRDS
eukprot:TRINITY_DN22618_c0_g1_i4.p1 TRINITY_DN22618_c0_g1~~TRINITY_DN22618_c0_g1_i4.p1  ORF type:complete len:870 (+),score=158.42 TRINITY_DN22618_c0_g1_i4:128-2737(+)